MAITITVTKDHGSSRVFLRRRTTGAITKPLEPLIQREGKLDRPPARRKTDVTYA
jgi:hypothetical protein